MGVVIVNVNEQIIKEFNLKSDKGAFVTGVNLGSPADLGGLQPYDVVVEMNGQTVEDARDMTSKVADTKVGQTINLKVIREGKPQNLAIKILERNDEQLATVQQKQKVAPKGTQVPVLGIEISDLNGILNQQLRLPTGTKGVVIVSVKANGVADQAGLQPGDIILDVNKKPVKTVQDALSKFSKKSNSLRISRGGQTLLFFMDAE
jgi:serine protease Do